MGVSEDKLADYLTQYQDEHQKGNEGDADGDSNEFEYWPENETAITAFIAARRHWDRPGLTGLPVCLDPHAVDLVLRRMDQDHDMALFEDVMTIGDSVVECLQKRFAHE